MAEFPALPLFINTTVFLADTLGMTTREVGEQALRMLRGDPSAFDRALIRRRMAEGEWSRTRQRIFARDEHRCSYCGSVDDLQCDHKFPWSRGGSDDDSNLTTACRPCNASKGARTIEEWTPAHG